MVDYADILTDPYNPIVMQSGIVKFPTWLSEKEYDVSKFQHKINWSLEDHAIHLHASFYDATVWYPWIKDWTPESRFISLTEGEVKDLIWEQKLPDDKKSLVLSYIRQGFRFVKSSKKSSHFRLKVASYEQFLDEITHPQVIMSFKNGCSNIFMRRYVDDITAEYRVYVYGKKIRYAERYLLRVKAAKDEDDQQVGNSLVDYVTRVMESIRYMDFVLDVAAVPSGFICIEINTPVYLFAALNFAQYYFERDKIHTAEEPIFRF